MKNRCNIDLAVSSCWITAWLIVCIMAFASCCQPKIISKQGNIYRVKYMGKTYFTDSPKTIKKDL